jgi:hypothetical protein
MYLRLVGDVIAVITAVVVIVVIAAVVAIVAIVVVVNLCCFIAAFGVSLNHQS